MKVKSRTSSCGCSRRCSRGGCEATSGRSIRSSPTSSSCFCSRSEPWGRRSGSTRSSPRASSRPRTPGSFPHRPKARPTFRSRRWPFCSDRSPRSSARTRRWITSIPPSGRVVRTRRSIPAACSLRSNPRKSAAKARLPSFSACGSPPTPFPAWRCISRTSRTSTSPVAFPRASSSTRCNRAIPRSCTRSRRRCARRSPKSRGCATSPPISTSRIRR